MENPYQDYSELCDILPACNHCYLDRINAGDCFLQDENHLVASANANTIIIQGSAVG